MPKWEERESNLLRRLQQHEGTDPDAASPAAPRRSGLSAQASVQAEGGTSATSAAPAAGPRLVVGAPVAPQPSPQPSVDLLGEDVLAPASQANGAPLMSNGAQSSAAAPPKPTNPVDLLADLLSDAVVSPTPAPAAAPAAQPPAPVPYGMPPPAQQPPAMPAAYAPVQQPYGAPPPAFPTAYPPAPTVQQPPVPSANPFASPTAPPAAAPQPPLQATASFGGSGAFGAPGATDPFGAPAFGAPPPAQLAFEPARPAGSLENWFTSLLVKDKGILYEDQYLQVGVQSRYARGSGQVVLFLGNKHGEQPLMGVSLVASAPPGLQLSVGPAPPALAPKQQVQVVVSAAAVQPYNGVPSLLLSYVLGGMPVQQPLQLPVVAHKFVVPEPTIGKDFFFSEWKANRCVCACIRYMHLV